MLTCSSVVLEYAAFIILRVKQPELKRPFRWPGPLWLICLMLSPSLVIACLVVGYGCFRSVETAVPNIILAGLGFALWAVMRAKNFQYVRRRRGSEEDAAPTEAVVVTTAKPAGKAAAGKARVVVEAAAHAPAEDGSGEEMYEGTTRHGAAAAGAVAPADISVEEDDL